MHPANPPSLLLLKSNQLIHLILLWGTTFGPKNNKWGPLHSTCTRCPSCCNQCLQGALWNRRNSDILTQLQWLGCLTLYQLVILAAYKVALFFVQAHRNCGFMLTKSNLVEASGSLINFHQKKWCKTKITVIARKCFYKVRLEGQNNTIERFGSIISR